jgi:putative acetyltransferase
MTLTIRPEHEEDAVAIAHVHRQAFGQENEARLVNAIRESPACIPDLSLVAERDRRIVGHILFSEIHIDTDDGPVPVLSLAPMAVHPDFQRRGIGAQLLREGLDAARRLGRRIVLVLGHPDYYPRFGFTPARAQGIEPPWDNIPDDAWMILDLLQNPPLAIRGIARYPAPFDDV